METRHTIEAYSLFLFLCGDWCSSRCRTVSRKIVVRVEIVGSEQLVYAIIAVQVNASDSSRIDFGLDSKTEFKKDSCECPDC